MASTFVIHARRDWTFRLVLLGRRLLGGAHPNAPRCGRSADAPAQLLPLIHSRPVGGQKRNCTLA